MKGVKLPFQPSYSTLPLWLVVRLWVIEKLYDILEIFGYAVF